MNLDIWTWTIPIGGLIALLFAAFLYFRVSKQNPGDTKIRELSKAIREGAMAFLNSEYKVLSIFVSIVAILLFIASFIEGSNIEIGLPVAFIIGAIFSALAGNIGMRMATMANGRTAEGTKNSLAKGLSIAFSSGAVMGMCVVGLGVLGVFSLFFMFTQFLAFDVVTATNMLFGFGFGASSIALFARVGGGIYTKAADVGADLVGKVEAGIPEDDPRNPAVIADQVGDNVGDVAGMGADLFESYVDSLIATMALAAVSMAAILSSGASESLGQLVLTAANIDAALWLPLVLASFGILSSIAGVLLVVVGAGANVYSALRNSLYLSAVLTAILSGVATWFMLGDLNPFYAILAGLAAGLIIGYSTEYYTSEKRKPAQSIADASKTGPATVIIQGLQVGMMSTIIPVIAVVAAMLAAYYFANFYGVAISAVGMLSILGVSLATDCYGPVADNAQGISEMAGMGKEVRENTEQLDAVGNTTAAMGKGFAIGSAAITALALIFTFIITAGAMGYSLSLDLADPNVVVGVFIGAMLPFVFTALTMGAVGRAAYQMVEEVRRQFKELNLLKSDKNKPDYKGCVAISTKQALKEMVLPSVLAVISPIIVGIILKPEGLGGLLVGSIATGFLLAVFLANSGGAWDNAKKYVESGNLGGKGSEAHKATVIGDTVGDPFKDTSGPSLNILIKLMSIVSLVFLPLIIAISG
ncbi:MAG: sodium-translocating pyrophosphatase [Candidatus Thermoplasmatota archaeon]|nr:sodium-translocating pyrophosphatase [Candidatus Thermoplasmatota archaeon]MBS3801612.1 sodium-translocating pyrophosphatase [Candidatus Thermoplasmatota archaeon]